jgi:hypothetical protein
VSGVGPTGYRNDAGVRTAAIARSNSFVFFTPESSYGTSRAAQERDRLGLSRMVDRKPSAFVSYGSAMGAGGVQELRQTAIEVHLAPIRSSVHIPVATLWAHFLGGDI